MNMEHWWNDNWNRKTEVLGDKPAPEPLSPYELLLDRTRTSRCECRTMLLCWLHRSVAGWVLHACEPYVDCLSNGNLQMLIYWCRLAVWVGRLWPAVARSNLGVAVQLPHSWEVGNLFWIKIYKRPHWPFHAALCNMRNSEAALRSEMIMEWMLTGPRDAESLFHGEPTSAILTFRSMKLI